MASMKTHHVGVAVFAIADALPFYLGIGYVADAPVYDPEQNVEVCVLRKEDATTIELLAPHDEKSPINGILSKSGAGPYHVCYSVDGIDNVVRKLKQEHFMLVSRAKVSNAFAGRNVCFMFRKDIGLIELIEENSNEGI